MSTGSTWLILQPTSILALDDLTTDFRDALLDELAQVRADVYGGDGTLGTTKASLTYAAGALSLDLDAVGFAAEGDRIELTAGFAEWTGIPFKDTGGVTYQIGARVNRYPTELTTDTIDGLPIYSQEAEAVGELGAPSAVVDTGTGLRFTITSLVGTGNAWTAAVSRPVKVWKVTPATGVLADTVVDGLAEPDGAGGIRVTITGYLGQDTPSTTAADYLVLVLGPTITTTVLATNAAYWYLGSVTTGVYTNTAAASFMAWADWLASFLVEHNAGGNHTDVSGLSYSYRAGGGRNGTFQVDAYEIATGLIGFRQNGGANQTGSLAAAGAAEPANIRTTGGISGTYAEILIPLRFPPDQAIIVNSLSASIWLLTAGATEYFTIELIERANAAFSGAIVVRATWTMGKPAAATWGTVVPTAGPAFPMTLPAPATPDVIRYWRVRFYEPNPGSSRIAGFYGGAAAAKVSPLPY